MVSKVATIAFFASYCLAYFIPAFAIIAVIAAGIAAIAIASNS
jgi:hypothetical protein